MFATKTHKTVATLLWGMACLLEATAAQAASPLQLSGAISGVVTDSFGVPQMGATVMLYSRLDRMAEKVVTNDRGEFRFPSLLPDLYTIRVNLATFLPAFRSNIKVMSGLDSVLAVNLSGVFSTIQFSYPSRENGSLITDDWKWVLRSASATRPVLRFLDDSSHPNASSHQTAVFSDTRGLLKLSAGEGSLSTSIGNQADLGTAFALATSLYGNSSLQVSGNVAYGSQTGAPSAAFRTSYSRNMAGGSPEVSLTMRQLSRPGGRLGQALAGGDAMPIMRTMSAALDDRTQVMDGVTLQYGFTMDSVVFLERLNYFSPYARLSYDLGDGSRLEFAYTSGNARPDMAGQSAQDDLQRDLNTLAMYPNVSLRAGRPKVQRGEEYELIYSRKMGSRTVYASLYRESLTNAALNMVAPMGLYTNGDLLPDLFSNSSVFNAGDYRTAGYTGAVTQNLGDNVSATVLYGSMGALTADQREIVSQDPDELRSMIHAGRRHAATVRLSATAPWTGTHMLASYQWTSGRRWAMPGNLYSTQAVRQAPGLNIMVRQPIPAFGLPWRMEATADLRNMLAQGYLPLHMANGGQLLLVETPRSFRGGLNFIF